MQVFRVVGRLFETIYKVVFDTRLCGNTRSVEVVGTVGLKLQNLSDTKVIDEPDTQPLEGLPEMLGVHRRTTERLWVKVRVDDSRVRLRGTIETILRRLARPKVGQSVIWCG